MCFLCSLVAQLLRAEIGIFLLMDLSGRCNWIHRYGASYQVYGVLVVLESIFGVLDTSSFGKLGLNDQKFVFFAKCFVPKALTMFLKMFFKLFWMRKFTPPPKKKQGAQLASGGVSTHWTDGFFVHGTQPRLNQRISWKSQEHFTGSGHCPGSWVTKDGKWLEVGSWYSKTRVGYEWIRVSPMLYTS